jgi:hypothetical protein
LADCGGDLPPPINGAMVRLLLVFLLWLPGLARSEPLAFAVPGGAEIVSQRHAATSEAPVLIWLTGQYGALEPERQAAAWLATQGVEVWLTDLIAPFFLPLLASSPAAVPDGDLAAWGRDLRARLAARRIVLAAAGHMAEPALRLAGHAGLGEAVLLFPLLYQRGLEPGEEAEYAPVVDRARLRLVLLQPKSSAGYWWRERLQTRLEAAGSQVRIDVLPGLRDGFYRRADANEREMAAGARLGEMLLGAMRELPMEKSR